MHGQYRCPQNSIIFCRNAIPNIKVTKIKIYITLYKETINETLWNSGTKLYIIVLSFKITKISCRQVNQLHCSPLILDNKVVLIVYSATTTTVDQVVQMVNPRFEIYIDKEIKSWNSGQEHVDKDLEKYTIVPEY